MITDKIQKLIIERTDFINDELESLTERVFATVTRLVAAGEAFKKIEETNPDSAQVAAAIMDFASGLTSSKLTAQKKDELKLLFKGFYRGMDESQTAIGVELFVATFDLDSDVQALNELADKLLHQEPPVEPTSLVRR